MTYLQRWCWIAKYRICYVCDFVCLCLSICLSVCTLKGISVQQSTPESWTYCLWQISGLYQHCCRVCWSVVVQRVMRRTSRSWNCGRTVDSWSVVVVVVVVVSLLHFTANNHRHITVPYLALKLFINSLSKQKLCCPLWRYFYRIMSSITVNLIVAHSCGLMLS